ncbi:MAG: hypothetical protein M0R38_10115 [Bacteroidia bacterium]|nr:hypothetical protein [Bacteroidia bacterium]
MNKYHVKFSHMVQLPISNQTNIPIKIIDVDDIYQVEPNVNIFTLIYSRFSVIGSITAITLSDE